MNNSPLNQNRIAIFIPSLNGGGAERVMVTLANNFVRRGYAVDLILAAVEGAYFSEVSKDVNIVDFKSRRLWRVLPGMVNYLQRSKPAVLLAAMGNANVVSVVARQIARVPTRIIISERSNFTAGKVDAHGWRSRLLPLAMKKVYPYADGVIAVSEGVADDLAKSIKLPREKIDVVYNPVMTDLLMAQKQMMPDHIWLTNKEVPVIIGMGRLQPQKDFFTLIKAFALLRQKRAIKLIILGQGPLHVQLLALIKELGLQDDVDLTGFIKNPFAYLSHADLFVLSSRYEGLPNALIQAMACGLPVVSTDCPSGPYEILENGKWGQLVPVGEAQTMAQAMAAALDNPNPPSTVSRAAEFNVDKAVNGFLKVMLPNEHP